MNEEKNLLTNEILKKLEYKLDDNDPNIQEKYFHILDKIVDAVCYLRYDIEKKKSLFYSTDQIHQNVLEKFKRIDNDNQKFMIGSLAIKIAAATKVNRNKNNLPKIEQKLNELYTVYKQSDGILSTESTNNFYNEILNKQQDAFIKAKKMEIQKHLIDVLPLTDKKKEVVLVNMKLKTGIELLKNNNYSDLGIKKDKLLKNLDELHIYLNKIKPFSKKHIIIEKEQFEQLDHLFLSGKLSLEKIESHPIFKTFSKNEIKVILNKYYKLLLPYIDNIKIDTKQLNRNNVTYNYNHLKITNKDSYYKNLKDLLSIMDNNEMIFLLKNDERLKDMLFFLPLVNLFSEFNIKTLKSILINYDKINEQLKINTTDKNKINFNKVLNNLVEIIRLAEAYNYADEYTTAILKEKRISKILEEKQTSRNPIDYLNTYIDMLKQNKTTIPPVKGEYHDYIFESGNNYDVDRLLIGKNCYQSCIGPKGAGEEAFFECLIGKNADVLLIKNKYTNAFVGRILMFRKGNYVLMSPIQGTRGLNKSLYDMDFLTQISSQILGNAIVKRDNLNYVFLTNNYLNLLEYTNSYTNQALTYQLPHADLSPNVYIIGSRTNNIDINFENNKPPLYEKERKKIEEKKSDFLDNILKIKALNIYMTEDKEKIRSLQEEFNNIDPNHLQKVYIGQDFYIAITKDNYIEQMVLKTNDPRQEIEINQIINHLLTEDIDKNEDKNNKSINSNRI